MLRNTRKSTSLSFSTRIKRNRCCSWTRNCGRRRTRSCGCCHWSMRRLSKCKNFSRRCSSFARRTLLSIQTSTRSRKPHSQPSWIRMPLSMSFLRNCRSCSTTKASMNLNLPFLILRKSTVNWRIAARLARISWHLLLRKRMGRSTNSRRR